VLFTADQINGLLVHGSRFHASQRHINTGVCGDYALTLA
jgi:hypothetical protein